MKALRLAQVLFKQEWFSGILATVAGDAPVAGESGFNLRRGEFKHVPEAAGSVCVECHSGVVWATQEGVTQDVVLRTGESKVFAGRGRVLVEALTAARVGLATAQTSA